MTLNEMVNNYPSPIRCGHCKGTNLEPLSDCKWDSERGEWAVMWVQLDEGYCRDCDLTVQYEEITVDNNKTDE